MSSITALATEGPDQYTPMTADEVVAGYWSRAFRFAAMVAPGSAESQDIAQEALLLAIRKLHRFDASKGSFDAWLWRIVINVARDAGRASVRRAGLFERLRGERAVAPTGDIEDLALQRIDDAQLLSAVRALNPRQRTLVALRFGAGLTYPEIAAQLRTTEAAALMATRRALDSLRKNMTETT
jgi:RNA polymerase sigma-70 factor (ECF subfamily)